MSKIMLARLDRILDLDAEILCSDTGGTTVSQVRATFDGFTCAISSVSGRAQDDEIVLRSRQTCLFLGQVDGDVCRDADRRGRSSQAADHFLLGEGEVSTVNSGRGWTGVTIGGAR